jgi:hypothetical protein
MINPEVIVYIKNGYVYYNDDKAFVKQVPKTYSFNTPLGSPTSLSPISPTITRIGVDIQFDEVDGSGTTNITQLAEFSNPALPNTFYLSDAIAVYQINTTASFVGDITLCFTLPEDIDSLTFSALRIFHKDGNGDTNDVTVLTGSDAPDFATRRICAKFSSFSEFYIIPEQDPYAYPYPMYFSQHVIENKEISW